MAFEANRVSVNAAGLQGGIISIHYDGAQASGGDSRADIKGNGFLSGEAVKDIVKMGSNTGAMSGVPILIQGNDGLEWNVAYWDSGASEIRMRNGEAIIT